jgi:hypothetical protein
MANKSSSISSSIFLMVGIVAFGVVSAVMTLHGGAKVSALQTAPAVSYQEPAPLPAPIAPVSAPESAASAPPLAPAPAAAQKAASPAPAASAVPAPRPASSTTSSKPSRSGRKETPVKADSAVAASVREPLKATVAPKARHQDEPEHAKPPVPPKAEPSLLKLPALDAPRAASPLEPVARAVTALPLVEESVSPVVLSATADKAWVKLNDRKTVIVTKGQEVAPLGIYQGLVQNKAKFDTGTVPVTTPTEK